MFGKRILKSLCILFGVLLLLMASAFADGEVTEGLTLDREVVIVAKGRSLQLKVTATPRALGSAGFLYSISDETIATVNRQGGIKGVELGECELTITSKKDENYSITVPVQVVIPVKKVTAVADPKVINIGETGVILPEFSPEEATLHEATYASTNEKVATVDEFGVVTGLSKGQAYIVVKSKDGLASTKVAIRVKQPPTSVTVTAPQENLTAGRSMTLKAVAEPRNADNRTVTWFSSNENVATVNANGQVKGIAPGRAIITAACKDDMSVTGSVMVRVVRLAKTVEFDEKSYGVTLNTSRALSVTVGPEDTTDKSVKYSSTDPKVVSVDEYGVVTALAPGKATIYATATDGSKVRGKCTVNVIVPVTGVSFDKSDVRIGKNQYGTFTATIEPKKASNKNMIWESSDENIATVTGTANKVKVRGINWGRALITGTTEDGSYTCSFFVNVGSLRHAVTVSKVRIRNGKPYLEFKNNSDMNITNVLFVLTGVNEYDEPVVMSTRDGEKLYGEYQIPMAPGDITDNALFTYYHRSDFAGLEKLNVCILGWDTDTGYVNASDSEIYFTYDIAEDRQEWHSYESELYQTTVRETPAPEAAPEVPQ